MTYLSLRRFQALPPAVPSTRRKELHRMSPRPVSACPFPSAGAALALALALGIALGAAGCAKDREPTLVTIGSRKLTVEDFKAFAREPQIAQQYGALPESAQKRGLLDDLIHYELLAEAAVRKGYDKDTAYTRL